MNKSKIDLDLDLVIHLSLEIADKIKLILKIMPEMQDQSVLKHLSAASIHHAMFVKDIYNSVKGIEENLDYLTKKFLEECGCDFNIGITE